MGIGEISHGHLHRGAGLCAAVEVGTMGVGCVRRGGFCRRGLC